MQLTKLGFRALSSFNVWITALLWTLSYADGAGFGAATYRNECTPQRGAWGTSYAGCPLVHHALFPPHAPLLSFIGNIFVLWFDGMYDTGLMFGFFLTIILLLCASQMRRYLVERVFSWPVIALGCLFTFGAGYLYEVHRTLSTGVSGAQLF